MLTYGWYTIPPMKYPCKKTNSNKKTLKLIKLASSHQFTGNKGDEKNKLSSTMIIQLIKSGTLGNSVRLEEKKMG